MPSARNVPALTKFITEPGVLLQWNNLWVPEPGRTGDQLRYENLADSLGLTGKNVPADQLAEALDNAVGANGTKLCRVTGAAVDGETIIVRTNETVCSAGEPAGSNAGVAEDDFVTGLKFFGQRFGVDEGGAGYGIACEQGCAQSAGRPAKEVSP